MPGARPGWQLLQEGASGTLLTLNSRHVTEASNLVQESKKCHACGQCPAHRQPAEVSRGTTEYTSK